MPNNTIVPVHYQYVVRNLNVSTGRAEVGTVPMSSGSEIMLSSLNNLNSAFSEMTKTLRSRDRAPWRKSA